MIDLAALRANPDIFAQAWQDRGEEVDVAELLAQDEQGAQAQSCRRGQARRGQRSKQAIGVLRARVKMSVPPRNTPAALVTRPRL